MYFRLGSRRRNGGQHFHVIDQLDIDRALGLVHCGGIERDRNLVDRHVVAARGIDFATDPLNPHHLALVLLDQALRRKHDEIRIGRGFDHVTIFGNFDPINADFVRQRGLVDVENLNPCGGSSSGRVKLDRHRRHRHCLKRQWRGQQCPGGDRRDHLAFREKKAVGRPIPHHIPPFCRVFQDRKMFRSRTRNRGILAFCRQYRSGIPDATIHRNTCWTGYRLRLRLP